MRKHFFCAKNIEDYRKVYHPLAAEQQKTNESFEEFEQRFFLSEIKRLFRVPQEFFESEIFGETGFEGLRLDFNFGLRLDVPAGNFRVVIGEVDSGELLFDKYISDGRLLSVEQYFIRWHVAVFLDDEKIFEHTLDLARQPVMLAFRHCGLGDLIALLPFVREFKKRHHCEPIIFVPDYMREFTAHLYPEIPQASKINFQTYAAYYPQMVMAPFLTVPVDSRNMPMERTGCTILGVETLAPKPRFKPTAARLIREPYVCIGVQASTPRKGWLYPGGWEVVVAYLKSLGYRVLCIDKNSVETKDGLTSRKPDGAEDFTGGLPIMARANMLYHAEFFIGLGSGLSWLADAVNCSVVMICGFSQDWFEFYTPYRVANRRVCNGCFNDIRAAYLEKICPYHEGTPRELECQKKISPRMVIEAIERLIVDKNLLPPALKNFA